MNINENLSNLMKLESQYRKQMLYFEAQKNEASYYEKYYREKANEMLEKIKAAD